MRAEKLEYISVSSINAFQSDRLRWCYAWLENRVPRRTPQALVTGKIVHKAFEKSFAEGTQVGEALASILPAVSPLGEEDSYNELKSLIEPLRFWKDYFPIEATLEVEQSFEFETWSGLPFRGRPDRVAVIFGKAFHIQNKTIGASIKADNYISVARRNMHELLYGWYLRNKYKEMGLEYSGTIYNVIRKLKYRSMARISKKRLAELGLPEDIDQASPLLMPHREILNTPEEMFLQTVIGMDERQIESAREDLTVLSIEMERTADAYLSGRPIPSTRGADSGYYGSSIDPYTLVFLNEISLDDDEFFADREETYGSDEASF